MRTAARIPVLLLLASVLAAPAAAIDINDTDSLDYWSDTTLDFRVDPDGTIQAQNNLELNGNDINSIGDIGDVDSTDVVGNLNADDVDGHDASQLCQSDGTNCPTDNTGTDDQTLSEVLTQGQDAGSQEIQNLADPTDPQDAATRSWVNDNDANTQLGEQDVENDIFDNDNDAGDLGVGGNNLDSVSGIYSDDSSTGFFGSCADSGSYIHSISADGSVTCATDTGVTSNRDLTTSGGLTGGENDVLVGAEGDVDISIASNGVTSSELDETDSYSLDWSNLGIAQSDVSASDVGLGNVQNLDQANTAGNELSWDSTNNEFDVDEGSNSGLNADMVDSLESSSICQSDGTNCPTDNTGTDDQTLSEVLTQNNVFGGNDMDAEDDRILFRDEDNSADIELSTVPSSNDDYGLTLRTTSNPPAGEAIFRVLSSGGSERLRVEHDGTTSTSNSFDASGYTEGGSNTLSNDISGDADTLDGVELTNIDWADVAMAQGDVSASDVGLGNVQNLDQANTAGNELSWDSTNNEFDVDEGSNSGLNADQLDGNEASVFCQSDGTNCPTDNTGTDDQTLSEVLTQGQDAGSQEIQNLADPTDPQDAATRSWVNDNDAYAADDQGLSNRRTSSPSGLNSDLIEIGIDDGTPTTITDYYEANTNTQLDEQAAQGEVDMNGNPIQHISDIEDSASNTMVNFDHSNRDVEINDNTGFQLPVGTDAW